MDIVVKGRNTEVTERFREHVAEKLAKLEKLDPKVISIDVECSQEKNPRLADQRERVEITILSRGPGDPRRGRRRRTATPRWTSRVTKLEARLRRAHDRRRVHHGAQDPGVRGRRHRGARRRADPARPLPVGARARCRRRRATTARCTCARRCTRATPMNLDQALYEMELVGHDFYLFVDAETAQPSVVYRRRGLRLRRDPAGRLTVASAARSAVSAPHRRADVRGCAPVRASRSRRPEVSERCAGERGSCGRGATWSLRRGADPRPRRRRPRAVPSWPGDGARAGDRHRGRR